jgi:hypothetical protein
MSVVVLSTRNVRAESWTLSREVQLWFGHPSVCTEIAAWYMFRFLDIYFQNIREVAQVLF